MDINQAVEMASNKEEKGYRWLYKQYYSPILHLFKHGFRFSSDVSEDLLQETFIDAFYALKKLREADRFGAWIHTIARNKAIKRLKEERKISDCFDQYVREFNSLYTAQDCKRSERIAKLVKESIDSLPESPLKECVRMYYWNGQYTVDEVAEKQGTTRGTITTRLKRFRDRIRKKLTRQMQDMGYVE